MMHQFAQNYANKGIVRLREIFTPGTLQVPKTPAALKELESIHKVIFFLVSLLILGDKTWSCFQISLVQKFYSLMQSSTL
jgi:ATP-dependent RNA helicase SUPV3L1/SUV3